jgi:hypothetical protein
MPDEKIVEGKGKDAGLKDGQKGLFKSGILALPLTDDFSFPKE